VTADAIQDEARVLECYETAGLLVDDLVQPLLDAENFTAIRHHLRVESHASVDQSPVDRLHDLFGALHANKIAGLQTELYGRRASAGRNPSGMDGKGHTATQRLDDVVKPPQRRAEPRPGRHKSRIENE
jgi:hypothetical protein